MDHVKMVSPTYEISAILLKGSYIANIQLKAMNHEGLMAQNLELGSRDTSERRVRTVKSDIWEAFLRILREGDRKRIL